MHTYVYDRICMQIHIYIHIYIYIYRIIYLCVCVCKEMYFLSILESAVRQKPIAGLAKKNLGTMDLVFASCKKATGEKHVRTKAQAQVF